MGELIDLFKWKAKKEEAEVEELRSELKEIMDRLEPIDYVPVMPEEDDEAFTERMISVLLKSLDGYRNWPIDSSDLQILNDLNS